MPKKGEIDLKKIEFDNDVDNDEIKDLDNEDALHFNDGLAGNNNNNNIEKWNYKPTCQAIKSFWYP